MNRSLSALPFEQATNFTRPAAPIQKRLLVLHSMEYPLKRGAAKWCAGFFSGPDAPKASAHACVDPGEVIQCVPWGDIAWHAPGANQWGIGIEHAGFARFSIAEWTTPDGHAMLDNSAWLAAELCTKFKIQVDFLDHWELAAAGDKARGITTHAEVNQAFKKSDHTDPGVGFPIGDYLRLVSKYALDAGAVA